MPMINGEELEAYQRLDPAFEIEALRHWNKKLAAYAYSGQTLTSRDFWSFSKLSS